MKNWPTILLSGKKISCYAQTSPMDLILTKCIHIGLHAVWCTTPEVYNIYVTFLSQTKQLFYVKRKLFWPYSPHLATACVCLCFKSICRLKQQFYLKVLLMRAYRGMFFARVAINKLRRHNSKQSAMDILGFCVCFFRFVLFCFWVFFSFFF